MQTFMSNEKGDHTHIQDMTIDAIHPREGAGARRRT
jgi:hypothetical protein